MPPVDPEAKIPCPTPGHLHAELDRLTEVLTPPETEDSWEKMEKAVIRFAGITRGGGYKHVDVYVAGVGRTGIGSRLVECMLSDRGRLSGAATDLLTALAPRLGNHFGPLIPLYLPPVIRLLARPNKIFLKRADKCLSTIITHCPLGTMLPYISEGTMDKSEACRRASSTGLARACDEWTKETFGSRGVAELENCLRKIAVDKDAEVRKIGKRIWNAYTAIWPERVDDFSAPLTPTIRRYLDISAAAGGSSRPKAPPRIAKPAPPPLLSSSGLSSSNRSTVPNQRVQAPASRPMLPVAPVRSARAESKMPATEYSDVPLRTTVHRERNDAELSRPLLARSAATVAPLQGPVRPDVAKHGRSQSAAVLGSGAMREQVGEYSGGLSRAVGPPIRPNVTAIIPSTTEAYGELSAPRRFAPPARLAKHLNPEDFDAEPDAPAGGPLRGAARALPMGETRRQLMGQAHRRAQPAPMSSAPSTSAPVGRTRHERSEVDLVEIAVRAAMMPLPVSPARDAIAQIAQTQKPASPTPQPALVTPEVDEHPASPSPVRPPQPNLVSSTSTLASLQPPVPLKSSPLADFHPESKTLDEADTPSAEHKPAEAEAADAELSREKLAEAVPIQSVETTGMETAEALKEVKPVENVAQPDPVISPPVLEAFTSPVINGIEAQAPAPVLCEAIAPPTTSEPLLPLPTATAINVICPAETSRPPAPMVRPGFKPRVAGRAAMSATRQPFKPTPSPSAQPSAPASRSASATGRSASASSAAGATRLATAKPTSPIKPTVPTSRPASVTGRSVSSSSTGVSRPTASTSARASPTKQSASSARPVARTTKPPIPPMRREPVSAPPTAAAGALRRSASTKPASMAPPPVPAVRRERVKLKAPLPSFVPKKPAAAAGSKPARTVRPEAVPLPSSPVKRAAATSVPLPASPAPSEAVATPLPPSPARPLSQQSLHSTGAEGNNVITSSVKPVTSASAQTQADTEITGSLSSSCTTSRASEPPHALSSSTNSSSHSASTQAAASDAGSDDDPMHGITFHPHCVSDTAAGDEDATVQLTPKEGDLLQLAIDETQFTKKTMPMTPGRSLAIKLGLLEGPGTPGTPVVRRALSEKNPNVESGGEGQLIDF